MRTLARLLDSAIRVPGTDLRIGLDPILGLVPGFGDVAGAGMAAYIVIAAARLGVPRVVVLRMLLNVALDTVIGSVPVLGDLFDAGWKANMRNVALIERYLERPETTRAASAAFVGGVIGGLILIAVAGMALATAVVVMIAHALSSTAAAGT